MKNLANQLNEKIAEFQKEMTAHVEAGNKAAGARARKASLELEKLTKDFRKKSIEASK